MYEIKRRSISKRCQYRADCHVYDAPIASVSISITVHSASDTSRQTAALRWPLHSALPARAGVDER